MMKTVLSLLLLSQFAFAGNDQGGGGHPCKAEAMQLIKNINNIYSKNSEVSEKYPEWEKMRSVVDPELNPEFIFQVADKAIENCPNTQSAFACSIPKDNILQLNCGENGWDTLSKFEKYKHIIHELYWWTDIVDTNYFYSLGFAKDVYTKINDSVNGRIFKSLGEGDIQTVDFIPNKVGCKLVNENLSIWAENKDNYECSSINCQYRAIVDYTIRINNEVLIPVQMSKSYYAKGNTLKSTIYEKCNQRAQDMYQASKEKWRLELRNVQFGIEEKKINPKFKNQRQIMRHCVSKRLEGFLNLETKESIDFTVKTVPNQCK